MGGDSLWGRECWPSTFNQFKRKKKESNHWITVNKKEKKRMISSHGLSVKTHETKITPNSFFKMCFVLKSQQQRPLSRSNSWEIFFLSFHTRLQGIGKVSKFMDRTFVKVRECYPCNLWEEISFLWIPILSDILVDWHLEREEDALETFTFTRNMKWMLVNIIQYLHFFSDSLLTTCCFTPVVMLLKELENFSFSKE